MPFPDGFGSRGKSFFKEGRRGIVARMEGMKGHHRQWARLQAVLGAEA